MNSVQSSLVPLELSEDNGVTWNQLICMDNYTVTMEAVTTDTNTQCGIAVGLGPIKFGASGSAVCEISPSAGQVTLNKMLTWLNIKEQILFRNQWAQGSTGSHGQTYYISGTCYVIKADVKNTTGDVVKFDFELKGTGLAVINPLT